jgi:hypothetical protein
MLKQEEAIKIDCRTDVMKFIKKRLDDMTVADFYSAEEYELIRKEYTEMAEMVRDKDKLMDLKEKHKQEKTRNISKYFKVDR